MTKGQDEIMRKIKESFESQHNTAPENLWNNLNDELSRPSDIDKVVKEGFEAAGKATAPNIWASISSQLNDKILLDTHVKNSFESVNESAPESTWDKLQNELDINNVWKRIAKELDRQPILAFWRVASAILLLIAIGAGSILFYQEQEAILTDSNLNPKTSLEKYVVRNNSNVFIDAETDLNIGVMNDYLVLLKEVYQKSDFNPVEGNSVDNLGDSEYKEKNNQNLIRSNNSIEESDDLMAMVDNLKMTPTGIKPISNKPIIPDPEFEITKREEEKFRRLSIGVIGGIQNSWILDDMTKESFKTSSLISSAPVFGENYGLILDYAITPQTGLTSEWFYNSRMRQKTSYYDQGKYKTKITDINYYKVSLMFYHKTPLLWSKKHEIKYGIGAYGGLNKFSSTITNDVITGLNSGYSSFDYGVRATLGEEYEFNRLVFGYGIQSEYGLNNIQLNPSNNQSQDLSVHNFNVGLFVNLRYKL